MMARNVLLVCLILPASWAFVILTSPSSTVLRTSSRSTLDHLTLHASVPDTSAAQLQKQEDELLPLTKFGWRPFFANQLASLRDGSNSNAERLVPVRVTQVLSRDISIVGAAAEGETEEQQLIPNIPPNNNQQVGDDDCDDRAQLVVGDWILINERQQIIHVLKRHNLLQRRAPGYAGKGASVQRMAANIDTAFIVSSCNQEFNVARLERYVVMAVQHKMTPVIVLTKRDEWENVEEDEEDIEDDDEDEEEEDNDHEEEDQEEGDGEWENDGDKDEENSDGNHDVEEDDDDGESDMLQFYFDQASAIMGDHRQVPVVLLDARGTEESRDKLQEWLQPGKTSVLLGSSGVGKSSLVNSLLGSKVSKTGEIHMDSGQGRHTTTRRQLHFLRLQKLDGCCAILDTPGLRELQLINVSDGLDEVFEDLVELAGHCGFRDCQHAGEPDCAIERAISQEDIDPDRVERWQKLVAENELNSKIMKDVERSKSDSSKTQGGGGARKKKATTPKSQQKKNKKYTKRLERDEY